MRTFPDPIFTPVAENIKANREDDYLENQAAELNHV